MKNKHRRAFTILELIVTMFLVAVLMGPIFNTFQVSERLSRRNYKSFTSQNLAREMMNEIAKKSFDDPYQASTINVNLKPGPTHEEYIQDALAPKIANGTNEVTGSPRLINETLVNRSKYYNDIDDYDGYNTDESILPTLANGSEYIVDGENPYANLRVKVEVKSSASGAQQPVEVLENGATLGNDPKGLAITPDGKYAAVINAGDKTMSMINLQTGYEVDCGPNNAGLASLCDTPCTAGIDRIPLASLRTLPGGAPSYNLGEPSQIITGPAGDRFYILHKADILNPDAYSGISTIDMNPYNTPEVSFHKVFDTNLVSKDLRSNSINSIATDMNGAVYAATNGGGLSRSDDNGDSWSLQKLLLADGTTIADTIYCLAAIKRGYGAGEDKYVYAGGKGGLWISKNNGAWNRVGAAGSSNITAIAAMDNGYVIAGTDNGNVYVSREYDINFAQKYGPAVKKINALAIDDSYRAWAGNDTGQFFSENVFTSATVNWTAHMPQGVTSAKVNSIYIDRSQTYPAPFTDVLSRTANTVSSNPACPSLYADENGLHLFYLDDSGEVGAGSSTSFSNPKLWYVNSPDFGKTWAIPRKICGAPAGKAAWAHSEIIDKNGALHAVWRDNRSGAWQLYYNKSEDGGKTWLASDFCIGNEDASITLDNLYYQTGSALSDWLKYGSDKFVQIAVSNQNRVYAVFSSNSSSHYIRYSDDGGKTWPQKNKISFAKTSGSSKELIESINYIEPLKKLMLVLITGSDLKSRKMKYCDPDGKNFELNSNFNITGVAESSPPALNDEYKFTYIKTGIESQGDATYEYFRIDKIFSFPSYSKFDETKLMPLKKDMTGRALYKNISFNNKSYVFYHTNIFSEPPNFIFFNYSSDGGNSYSDPINFDSANNVFDKLTCASYSGVPYLVKRNANASPAADFFVSSFDKQIVFSACNGSLFYSAIGDNEIKNAGKYNFTNDKITCFSGDGDGNLIYGTSSGAYFRNINFGSTTYFTTGARADKVNFPISDYRWHHFFKGVSIKTVFAEKNGVLWVGTANKGIFRSNDYGENWKNIEAVKSNLNGSINFIGMGNANRINKLIFFSSRYNLKNVDDIASVVPEHLCSTYNLSNNCIESVTLITRGQYRNMVSAATNSYDNDKIIRYDGLEKKISVKKHDFTAISAVYTKNSSIDNYQQWGNSNLAPAGLTVTTADTLEILASRKYCVHSGEPYCFFSLPGGFWYQGPSNLSGQLKYNIANSDFDCLQYFYGRPAKSGELKYAINTSLTPRTQGYCLVKTVLQSPALAEINVSSKMNVNVNNAFTAPDNKTIFFTNYADGKVYSVFDINDTASIQVKEYSENVANPLSVIFSPKNRSGEYKTYIVCKNNIVDLYGNKMLADISGLDISGAAFSDNGDLYFVDKTTKKLYKCVTSIQKTVYVTVKEADDSAAGSMPPVTLVRKFHNWQAANEIRRGYMPNRNYIKYNYIYTSMQYPSGISATRSETWSPRSAEYDTLNAYIVDSVLNVNGTLEILAGTLVKFATADKSVNTSNWSGKSNSCIKVGTNGKLLISGGLKESEHVLFTSLDDSTAAPSAYSGGDLSFKSAGGLANPQLMRVKSGTTEPLCGAKYGDWGKSDGTAANSFGGLHLASAGSAVINNLETRYALLYTKSIYPGNVIPPNFSTTEGINEWTGTNVYVVNDTLEIGNQTRLDINKGAIIKCHTNAALSLINANPDVYPWYSIIADGSGREGIKFTHVSDMDAGHIDGQTPNGGDGKWAGLNLNGAGDISNFKSSIFLKMASIVLSGANASFYKSNFGASSAPGGSSFILSLKNKDASKFHSNTFHMIQPCHIELSEKACNLFESGSFEFNFDYGAGTGPQDYLISAASNSTLIAKNNDFGKKFQSTSLFNGSKIKLSSAAYISGNVFQNFASTGNQSQGASAEVSVLSSTASFSLPVIENNIFESCKCAIYIGGDGFGATSAILENRIVNNSFIKCGTLIHSEVSDEGDFPKSPAGAAIDLDGNVYFTDADSCAVYKYSPNGRLMMKFGGPGSNDGCFVAPSGIAVNDTGEIYVVDWSEKRVQKFDRDGNFMLKFATDAVDPSEPSAPAGITVSTPATEETLFVTDSVRNSVMRFTNQGDFRGEILSSSLLAPSDLSSPTGLVASRDSEYLYVTDTDNHRVVKIKINLTTTEIELGDDYFSIEPRVFSVGNDLAVWPLGFAPGSGVDEGGHIELNVVARKGDGSTNEVYTGTKTGKIFIDNTAGIVTWEGSGITDNSQSNADNNAVYSSAAFVNGAAKFYVRNTMAGSNLKITIIDNAKPEMLGSAEVSWLVENTPPALEFVGANSKGFRRYTCKNDPSVTFIKIPASAFDNGIGSYTETAMINYYISETPTTNAQFKRWRDIVATGSPSLTGAWASNNGLPNYPDHPAILITPTDAQNYSYWLITGSNSSQTSMYLPDNNQYGKAMRGAKLFGVGNNGTEKKFPWGNTWDPSKCNTPLDCTSDERPLGSLGYAPYYYAGPSYGTTPVFHYPNGQGYYGLMDITGNVWIWLRDLNRIASCCWANGGWIDYCYQCSYSVVPTPMYFSGTIVNGLRPCFYWPLQ